MQQLIVDEKEAIAAYEDYLELDDDQIFLSAGMRLQILQIIDDEKRHLKIDEFLLQKANKEDFLQSI